MNNTYTSPPVMETSTELQNHTELLNKAKVELPKTQNSRNVINRLKRELVRAWADDVVCGKDSKDGKDDKDGTDGTNEGTTKESTKEGTETLQELVINVSQTTGTKHSKTTFISEPLFQALLKAFNKYPSTMIKSKHFRYKNKTLVAFDGMAHFCYTNEKEESFEYALTPSHSLRLTKTRKTPVNIYEFKFAVFYNDVKFINTTKIDLDDGVVLYFDKLNQVNGTVLHEMRVMTLQSAIHNNIGTVVNAINTIASVLKN